MRVELSTIEPWQPLGDRGQRVLGESREIPGKWERSVDLHGTVFLMPYQNQPVPNHNWDESAWSQDKSGEQSAGDTAGGTILVTRSPREAYSNVFGFSISAGLRHSWQLPAH